MGGGVLMGRLTGKVCFVTGGGGGIGREICRSFLSEGASVASVDVTAEAAAAGLGEHIDQGRAVALACDVGDPASIGAAIDAAVGAFGKLNVLLSVAGGSSMNDGPVTEAPDEEFWRVIRTDLFGTFQVCKQGIPHLIAAGGGSVINFSSVVAVQATEGRDCYTAAKGGIVAITRSIANHYAKDKVRVNAIAPGLTMTPRVQAMYDVTPSMQAFGARHLLGPCSPQDMANLGVFLASDESSHITGQILQVDSGVTIH